MQRRTAMLSVAGLAVTASVVLAGCGQQAETPNTEPTLSDEPVTLTLNTYGNFGYSEEFLDQFEKEYPNITVEHNIAASGTDVVTRIVSALAAGDGLGDVEAMEISWISQVRPYADQFYPVPEDEPGGAWVPAQIAPATSLDGVQFARGVGIGPSAICYREDMFEAAGFPTDPDEVAEMLEGDWQHYLDVGREYVANGGPGAWVDSAFAVYNSWVNQVEYPYEDEENRNVVLDSGVEDIFLSSLEDVDSLSANLTMWSTDWYAGMQNNAFATMPCPSWMALGVIMPSAPDASDWRIANVYPDGGGNWGGSFLAVPTQSEHPAEAQLLAQWLTAPEQQITAFDANGTFPSRLEAYDDPSLLDITNDYFGGAPIGEIFVERSEAIESFSYLGPQSQAMVTGIQSAMSRVESGEQTPEQAWEQFVTEVEALGDE